MFRITLRLPRIVRPTSKQRSRTAIPKSSRLRSEKSRAIGVGELARQSGVSRETIYKGFAPGGNPTLATITKVAKALGLRLTVVAA